MGTTKASASLTTVSILTKVMPGLFRPRVARSSRFTEPTLRSARRSSSPWLQPALSRNTLTRRPIARVSSPSLFLSAPSAFRGLELRFFVAIQTSFVTAVIQSKRARCSGNEIGKSFPILAGSMSAAPMVVQLTTDELSKLIRKEVREALAANSQQALQPATTLTAEEAASHLKVPAYQVRKYAREGKLKCFYIGTHMRFDVVDIEAYKEANRSKG
jgi:excisionase family DNA binding protein